MLERSLFNIMAKNLWPHAYFSFCGWILQSSKDSFRRSIWLLMDPPNKPLAGCYPLCASDLQNLLGDQLPRLLIATLVATFPSICSLQALGNSINKTFPQALTLPSTQLLLHDTCCTCCTQKGIRENSLHCDCIWLLLKNTRRDRCHRNVVVTSWQNTFMIRIFQLANI